jgi:hypothetical protein
MHGAALQMLSNRSMSMCTPGCVAGMLLVTKLCRPVHASQH